MTISNIRAAYFAGSLLVACGVTAGNAQATVSSRSDKANPTNFCQSALPVFDVQIRKRPLAVQNEGTSGAFVTCAFSNAEAIDKVIIYLASTSGQAQTVACTGVTGVNSGTNHYSVKSTELNGSGGQGVLEWAPSDFPEGTQYLPGEGFFGISCNLAPGMGVNDTYVLYRQWVGE